VLESMSSLWAEDVVVSVVRDNDSNVFEESLNNFSLQSVRRLPNARMENASTMSGCYLSQAVQGRSIDMIDKYRPDSSKNTSKDVGEMVW
jgi:hypothetical protein